MRVFALALLLATSSFVVAGEFSKNVSFALDKWIEVNSTDGPVTIHRFRLKAIEGGGLTKSKLFRPGNSENLQEVELQIEYSNDSSRDWDAHIDLGWYDSQGQMIDGYNDTESLNEEENHEVATVRLSTLKYGIKVAKKIKIKVEYERD